MTREDLCKAVKLFGGRGLAWPLARIDDDNTITLRNSEDTGDLLSISINGEIDRCMTDVRKQLSFFVHCMKEVPFMQPCPQCGEDKPRCGRIDSDPPMASMAAEKFYCAQCDHRWHHYIYPR